MCVGSCYGHKSLLCKVSAILFVNTNSMIVLHCYAVVLVLSNAISKCLQPVLLCRIMPVTASRYTLMQRCDCVV
jgi:hypothetical protein